jgi:hypothetical protein
MTVEQADMMNIVVLSIMPTRNKGVHIAAVERNATIANVKNVVTNDTTAKSTLNADSCRT